MTKEELIKLDSSMVRNDANLLSIYIDIFFSEFGYKPACASCTFSTDWNKLRNSKNIIIKDMSNKTFQIRDRSEIYTYRKGKKAFRMYGSNMTEEFALAYLSEGTKEEIEARKKEFKVLPTTEEVSKESDEFKDLTLKDLKELYPEHKTVKTRKEILKLISEV